MADSISQPHADRIQLRQIITGLPQGVIIINPDHAQESTESFGQRIRDALAAAEHAISGAASGLANQASGAASMVGSTASSLGAAAQGAAQGAMQSALGALSQSGKTGSNLATAITENPVMLGVLGLAAGALLGALLPVSEQEEAALGGIASQARDAATSLAQQALRAARPWRKRSWRRVARVRMRTA